MEIDESGSDIDADEEGNWDENCYVCKKAVGELLCCEKCTHVAHLGCA